MVLQAASFVKEGEFELHTKPMDTEVCHQTGCPCPCCGTASRLLYVHILSHYY